MEVELPGRPFLTVMTTSLLLSLALTSIQVSPSQSAKELIGVSNTKQMTIANLRMPDFFVLQDHHLGFSKFCG